MTRELLELMLCFLQLQKPLGLCVSFNCGCGLALQSGCAKAH